MTHENHSCTVGNDGSVSLKNNLGQEIYYREPNGDEYYYWFDNHGVCYHYIDESHNEYWFNADDKLWFSVLNDNSKIEIRGENGNIIYIKNYQDITLFDNDKNVINTLEEWSVLHREWIEYSLSNISSMPQHFCNYLLPK